MNVPPVSLTDDWWAATSVLTLPAPVVVTPGGSPWFVALAGP